MDKKNVLQMHNVILLSYKEKIMMSKLTWAQKDKHIYIFLIYES